MKIRFILLIVILSTGMNLPHAKAVQYKDNSLCSTQEAIYFSCTLENKKIVSLCGKEEGHNLKYRYGTQSLIELSYPSEQPKKGHAFYRINASGGSVQMDIIKFKIGAYTYNIYDSFFDGLAVWGPHGLALKKTCESNLQQNMKLDFLKQIPETPQQDNNFE